VTPEGGYEIKSLTGSIRRMIEVFALKTCFDDLDEEAFAKWEKIVEKMDKACLEKDYPTIYELDLEFHHEIIRRASIPDLEAIWKAILGRVRVNLRDTQKAFPDPGDTDIVAKHANLLEALRSGDRKKAVNALSSHDY
jgi:DNA-binding GntR family transcriptional regulator